MSSGFCIRATRARIAASALFVSLAAGAAAAQGHVPGTMGHRGPAHLEAVIAQLHSQLNLNTSQQLMWDNAVGATRTARAQGRSLHDQVHAAAQAELAKPEPDLAAMAALIDAALDQGRTLHRQVRDEWLKLYATFSPAQKTVVREALQARMARFERFRQHRHGRG